jgi:biotin operon repressor
MWGRLEHMTTTPARLLKLLSLLQMPRQWPGSELAHRLEVDPRTVRRDVDRLRELGYPVEATLGAAGGYRLVAGTALPPLLLDDEEAVAIAVGLRTAAGQPVAGIEDSAVRALAKLEQVLPSRLRYRVRSLGAATVQVTMPPALSRPGPQPAVDPERLTMLAGRSRTANGSGSGTARTTVPRPGGTSTRTGWSPPGVTGTSSPSTTTAPTGGSSGPTGSTSRSPPAPGSPPGSYRPRTSAPS